MACRSKILRVFLFYPEKSVSGGGGEVEGHVDNKTTFLEASGICVRAL